jgi:hypothetical protein
MFRLCGFEKSATELPCGSGLKNRPVSSSERPPAQAIDAATDYRETAPNQNKISESSETPDSMNHAFLEKKPAKNASKMTKANCTNI